MCLLALHAAVRAQKLPTAPCLGSPDVSTDAGILRSCQMSGNVGYAPMHRSLELFLAWKSLILYVQGIGYREFCMDNCTTAAIVFSALEGNAGSQERVGVRVLVCPQRFRIKFVAHAQAALYKHTYFGNPCQTVLVLYIPFLHGTIFHQDQ